MSTSVQRTGSPPEQHVPALDGLRGLAILAVIWHHASFEAERAGMVPFAGDPTAALYNVAHAAWSGVDLFFVLSGFLITGILLDAKGSPLYFRSFYIRRALRIFPLYYVTIAAVGVLASRNDGPAAALRLPWLLSYTTNIAMAIHHAWWFSNGSISLDHFWSLAVEEQFYLIWPVVVLRCDRRTLKRICLAMIVGAFVWRMCAATATDDHWLVFYQLPSRADSLAMGALTAIQVRDAHCLGKNRARKLIVATALLLVALLDGRAVPFVGLTALAWFYRSLLIAALTTRLALPLSLTPLRSVGKYSYGIYVTHMLILKYVWRGAGCDRLVSHRALALAGALFVCSYAAAFLSWHLMEKHFVALKRYFPMSEADAVPPESLAPQAADPLPTAELPVD
jgi:peptidoglycan/LPS O-acetylase OafA/YrhL